MFLAMKLVEAALAPSNLVIGLAALGMAAMFLRLRRIAAALVASAALLGMLAGWSPLGPAAVAALENRFPTPPLPAEITGMVLLGGAIDTHVTADHDAIALTDGGERYTVMATLARRYPQARLFLSGGSGHGSDGPYLTESAAGKRLLTEIGVPPERIEMEERSQTTCENARESVAALQPKPEQTWLLITSAIHMPRAVACFRAAGFAVLPYPVDYNTRPRDLVRPVVTASQGLAMADAAAHEWLGLLVYRLTGKTASFFPAP